MQRFHWDQSVGMLIGVARRRLKQEVGRRLRPYDLTPPQFGVLLSLRKLGPASLGELAGAMGIDAPTTSRIAVKLEERTLIVDKTDPTDKRRSRLSLSARGQKLADELARLWTDLEVELETGLTKTERRALHSGLHKIIHNIECSAQRGES